MNLKNLFLVTDIFKFLKLVKMKIFLMEDYTIKTNFRDNKIFKYLKSKRIL